VLRNRSVPVNTLLPHLVYDDVGEAISWLGRAFGFTEHYRYGENPDGAQLRVGSAYVMVSRSRPGRATPLKSGAWSQSLTVFVEDVEAHCERARAAGARILEEPRATEYGEFQYAAEDLAGHHWLFSRHAQDIAPEQWGAVVSHPAPPTATISPMLAVSDGDAAIRFYEAAFDAELLWRLESNGHVVAGLEIHGAPLFLAHESPSHGARGPASAGFTTVRIELFVDDPARVHQRAMDAGALLRNPVVEYSYDTAGPRPIRRMLQGSVVDPFGHMWLIGRFLD
jgi:uncharacterized glyoxalase superfamily protein PhnB